MKNDNWRILLLAGWYYPDSVGGTEEYVRLLGRELKTAGYDVRIAAPSRDGEEYSYEYDGLPVYRYPVSMSPDKAEAMGAKEPLHFDIFKKWLGRLNPDVVHMHSYTRGCGLFHAEYIRHSNIPLVVTVHVAELTCARGTMMRWGRIPCDGQIRMFRCAACWTQKHGIPKYLTPAISWRMMRPLMTRKQQVSRFLGFAGYVVAVSGWLYDVLALNGIDKSKLLKCSHGLPEKKGIDAQGTDLPARNGPLRIGYIGRFDPIKGVHTLINAVKKIPKTLPVELLLYGTANSTAEEAYLWKMQAVSADNARIIFKGPLNNEKKADAIKEFDILAVPSLVYETGPLVLLEAFAAGVPVIASDLGGMKELVRDGISGVLVRPGDARAWSGAIRRLALDRQTIRYLAGGIPPVRKSSDVAREMSAIYKGIIIKKAGE